MRALGFGILGERCVELIARPVVLRAVARRRRSTRPFAVSMSHRNRIQRDRDRNTPSNRCTSLRALRCCRAHDGTGHSRPTRASPVASRGSPSCRPRHPGPSGHPGCSCRTGTRRRCCRPRTAASVSLPLKRGLISVRIVRGPSGSSLMEYRWTLPKKNARFSLIGPLI